MVEQVENKGQEGKKTSWFKGTTELEDKDARL